MGKENNKSNTKDGSNAKDESNNQSTSSKMKGVLIFFAIIVVLVSFVLYGIDVFYPSPEYNDFCGDVPYQISVESCDNSTSINGMKGCYCNEFEGCMEQNPEMTECQENYNVARDRFGLGIFIIMSLIGIGLIFGNFFIRNSIVSNSLMGGGVIILFIGVVRGWNNFGEIVRFILLGIILAVLIYVTTRKLDK